MSILTLILVLVIVGVVLWAISALPFIDANIKKIIYVLVVVLVVVWLISVLFGLNFGNLGNIRIR
jgi:hypothetical protein